MIQLHMSLDQLLGLDGTAAATAEWAGLGAAAPPGADCDVTIVPVVTGHVEPTSSTGSPARGRTASADARDRARQVGIVLQPRETWIRSHTRGVPDGSEMRFLWHAPAEFHLRTHTSSPASQCRKARAARQSSHPIPTRRKTRRTRRPEVPAVNATADARDVARGTDHKALSSGNVSSTRDPPI